LKEGEKEEILGEEEKEMRSTKNAGRMKVLFDITGG